MPENIKIFRKFAWKNRFFTRIHDLPRFQTRLTPLGQLMFNHTTKCVLTKMIVVTLLLCSRLRLALQSANSVGVNWLFLSLVLETVVGAKRARLKFPYAEHLRRILGSNTGVHCSTIAKICCCPKNLNVSKKFDQIH